MGNINLDTWLAVAAGGDTVRLVQADASGPDVFCKALDAKAAIAAAVAAERELWKERAIAACNSAGDGPDNGCCPTYWEESREACISAIQKV